MKKTIIVITLIFLLGSCSNCRKPTITETTEKRVTLEQQEFKICKYGKIWKDYIVISDGNDGTLIKYNVHNGEMSFLCPDPFCRHEEDCQFAGVGMLSHSFDFIENTVYYANDEQSTGSNSLYAFDIDTAETKLLYESEGIIRDVWSYDKKLFIKEITGDRFKAESRCFWYDTATGKMEEYKGKNIETSCKLNWIMNDRMMWYSILTQDYFFTDLAGNEVKEYDMDYKYGNHYSVEYVERGEGSISSILYVTLAGKTEKKVLAENVGQVTYAEDKIVYTKVVPEDERRVAIIDELGKEFKDPYNGDVYIMNPDGSDNHLLFHCDELIWEMGDAQNGLISRNYIGIFVNHLVEGKGNVAVLMIVNIKTGEFIVTENLQERYARLWSES